MLLKATMTTKYQNLLELIICPTCKSPMDNLAVCHECGTRYDELGGTPCLYPNRSISRTVAFEFRPSRSVRTEDFEKAFSYPRRSGAAGGDYPYHLDWAHFDVINQLPHQAIILEIGCGGGQMRDFLRTRGYRYVGTDLSKTQLGLKDHGGADILCDAHFLPFRDNSFDLVYSSALTEHLACPYLVAQEVARCLKPGGYYLGNGSFLEPWHNDSFFHMSPLGIFELLTQAKLQPIHIWPGRGYSGFRAIMEMGNRATHSLTFVGDTLFLLYNWSNRVRDLIRPSTPQRFINDQARVSGATDWIAMRPGSA